MNQLSKSCWIIVQIEIKHFHHMDKCNRWPKNDRIKCTYFLGWFQYFSFFECKCGKLGRLNHKTCSIIFLFFPFASLNNYLVRFVCVVTFSLNSFRKLDTVNKCLWHYFLSSFCCCSKETGKKTENFRAKDTENWPCF